MRSVLRPLSNWATVSNAPAFWPCVWSPVCSTNAGRVGWALTRSMTCCSVIAASGLAWPLKPTWVSLICTKLKVPASMSAAAAAETTRERARPPVIVHMTAAPVHAAHSRNPRRFIRSMSSSARLVVKGLAHDHGRLHLRVQRAEVGVAARRGEGLREAVLVAEPARGEGARRRGDRVRLLVVIGPRDTLADADGQLGRPVLEVLDVHRRRPSGDPVGGGQQQREQRAGGQG